MKRVTLSTCALLIGCAASTGVMKMGPDTYSVTVTAAPAAGGIVGAKQRAFTQASDYCTAQAKEILVTNTNIQGQGNVGTADVTFRCLAAGDPGLQRPDYQPTPSAIIQDQRK